MANMTTEQKIVERINDITPMIKDNGGCFRSTDHSLDEQINSAVNVIHQYNDMNKIISRESLKSKLMEQVRANKDKEYKEENLNALLEDIRDSVTDYRVFRIISRVFLNPMRRKLLLEDTHFTLIKRHMRILIVILTMIQSNQYFQQC